MIADEKGKAGIPQRGCDGPSGVHRAGQGTCRAVAQHRPDAQVR